MKESVIAGPAPGRPICDPAEAPLMMRSNTVASRIQLTARVFPAAAVPVTVKMPEPITAPIPSAVRLNAPRDFFKRWAGSSDAATSWSMLLVRKSGFIGRVRRSRPAAGRCRLSREPVHEPLTLALALSHLTDFLLHG